MNMLRIIMNWNVIGFTHLTNPANQKIPNSFDPIICNRCDCVSELKLSGVFSPRLIWPLASEVGGRVFWRVSKTDHTSGDRAPWASSCLRRSWGTQPWSWNDSSGHWGRRLVCKILPLLHFDRSTLAFGTLSWSYLSLVFVSAVDKKETNTNKLLLETSFLIFSPDREKSKSQRHQNFCDLPNTLLSAGIEVL